MIQNKGKTGYYINQDKTGGLYHVYFLDAENYKSRIVMQRKDLSFLIPITHLLNKWMSEKCLIEQAKN